VPGEGQVGIRNGVQPCASFGHTATQSV
jgi:hypothetical protein